ncbi:MAG TPA: MFS transporter [Candidatus Limnocylindrales bacterium]|nr:MFS transporter [Candidatus Limnocylindrales bacterium]
MSPSAALDAVQPEAQLQLPPSRVGPGFVIRFTLAFIGTSLVFQAPILVTLPLKIKALVGIDAAPGSLGLVAGIAALLAIFANPFFGRMSDRTTSRFGMRRPWLIGGLAGGSIGILVIALAPNVGVVLVGWCMAQVSFNALLAAQSAVMPDQVPIGQRGFISGLVGIALPIAAVAATFLVNLFTGNELLMLLVPSSIGGFFVVLFAITLPDRRLAPAAKPVWSLREFAGTFYVDPRSNPDFVWAFVSRFLLVFAYAFLVTYQAYYLLQKIGSAEADVPNQIFLGTLVQAALLIAASLVAGRLTDRTGRRKVFVFSAAVVYGLALFVLAGATNFSGFIVGMAVSGLGFGMYFAVDLALVLDVLPDRQNAAKNLGVFNMASAIPFSLAPAIAPAILAAGGGSYGVLYMAAGVSAVLGALAITRVKGVR